MILKYGMEPIIQTQRLLLREMGLSNLDFIASMLAHPEVMRFWPNCYSREEAKAWVVKQQDRYASDGHGYWLAIERSTDLPIGQVGILTLEVDGVEELALGYMIHRPFWRLGFATEAAAACRDYTFDVIGRPRVITLIRPENEPSHGVALKLGMTEEKKTFFAGFEHVVYSMRREREAKRS